MEISLLSVPVADNVQHAPDYRFEFLSAGINDIECNLRLYRVQVQFITA